MQIANFAVNYTGRPFMQGFTENRGLMVSLALVFGLVFCTAAELSPDWNEMFEVVPLPDAFRQNLLRVMAIDLVGAFAWDRICRMLFRW